MRRLLPWLLAVLLGSAAAQESVLAAASVSDSTPDQQEELYQAALRELDAGNAVTATDMLKRLIKSQPRHAGAWLELAITQCDLGNAEEAERLFREIEVRFDPPQGIREVIATHRASGCRLANDRMPSWLVSLGRGHDSNVNQGASSPTFSLGGVAGELAPEFLPHPDSYSLLTASYIQPVNALGTQAIVQLYSRHHDHEHAQDSDSVLLGLEHAWNLGRWRTRLTGAFGSATLDGKLYQRQEQVQLRAAPPITLPDNLDLALISNVSHVTYPTRDAYNANTFELGTTLTYRDKRSQLQLTLSKLHDDGTDSRPGGNRSGWFGNLQWYTLLRSGLFAEAGLAHQRWQGSQDYSPGLIDVVRHQMTTNARAAVQWYFMPNVSLQLEGRVVRNRENISLFEYNSRALQLSLRWDNF